MLNPTNAGLQVPVGISTMGPSQPSAQISNTTNIDPSSMKRAYAALGLPYGNHSATQTQAQVLGQQTPQTQPHQQPLRPMNSLGNACQTKICAALLNINSCKMCVMNFKLDMGNFCYLPTSNLELH